jgi:hypothetical protein
MRIRKDTPLPYARFRKNGPEAGDPAPGGQDPKGGEGQDPKQPGSGEGRTGGQEPKVFDEEYVRALRKEAADARVKLKEFEDAQLTASQKLQKERDEALTELGTLREERRLRQFEAIATKEGAKYPDLVALKVPADTKPEDLVAAIKLVRKDYPELFQYVDGDGNKKGTKPEKETTPGMGTLREAYASSAEKGQEK